MATCDVSSFVGYGVSAPKADVSIEELVFPGIEFRPDYVAVEVFCCGICFSDIHRLKDCWSNLGVKTQYPLSPGHEVVGRVVKVGSAVTTFKIGDRVGTGPLRSGNCDHRQLPLCENCEAQEENLCMNGAIPMYSPNTGGFCSIVLMSSKYTFHIPEALSNHHAAPLLCAGTTVYSPLVQANLKPGARVGILGLGGLGHVAVQMAAKMGFEVWGFSTSKDKAALVTKYGGKGTLLLNDTEALTEKKYFFDYILNTVSGEIDLAPILLTLKPKGTLCCVGLGDEKLQINPFHFVSQNRKIVGSYVSGTKETRDMLEFCAKNNVVPEVEVVDVPFGTNSAHKVTEAVQRVIDNKVRFRMVLDYKKA